MELTDSLKALFIETAKALKGSARRLFMARMVKELGAGGQRRAERRAARPAANLSHHPALSTKPALKALSIATLSRAISYLTGAAKLMFLILALPKLPRPQPH